MKLRLMKYSKTVISFSWCFIVCTFAFAQNPENSSKIQQAKYYNRADGTKRSADLDKEPKVREYMNAAYAHKESDSAIFYFNKSLEWIKSSGDDYFLPEIYHNLTTRYENTLNKELALEYANLLLELATENDFSFYKYEAYRNMGRIYADFYNDFDRSIQNFRQALNYAQNDADALLIKLNIAWTYGAANQERDDPNKYDIAKTFLYEVKTYFDTIPTTTNYDILHVSYSTNICLSYFENGYELKLNYAAKALEDAYVIDSIYPTKYGSAFVASALNNLSNISLDNNDYESAKSKLQESLALAKKYNDDVGIYNGYINLAIANYGLKDYATVISVLDSINTVKATRAELVAIDSLYYKSYIKLNSYQQAIFHADRYIAVKDSINTIDKQNAYVEFGKKYQTEKKIQENTILTQENKIKDLTINKERNTRIFFSILAIIALLILAVLYYFYRNKQKTARILAQKNKTISVQNDALKEANSTKQKFFSIISHDLVNPFNAMLGYARLLSTDYDDFNDVQKKQFIDTIHNASEQNYKLVKSLLTWGRSQQNAIVAKIEELNCKKLIDLARETYSTFAKQKEIEIINKAPTDITCLADKNMMITCIGNIVNNAIKFTPKGGRIQIEVNLEGDKVYFHIKDDGVGMSKEKMDNLFAIDKAKSSKGTNDESGTGFGLMITKEFMKKQDGDITVSPNIPKGTVFTLVLPTRA